jgi:hypothetical protein
MVDRVPHRFEGSSFKRQGRWMGEGHLWRKGRFLSRASFPLATGDMPANAMSDEEQRLALIQRAKSLATSLGTP